jgi:hypothetical protein
VKHDRDERGAEQEAAKDDLEEEEEAGQHLALYILSHVHDRRPPRV